MENAGAGISGSFIRDNGSQGISSTGASYVVIDNNSITGNSSYGIRVNNYSEAFISYASDKMNLITGNRYGVYTSWYSMSYLNYNCLHDNNKNSTINSPGYDAIVTFNSIIEGQQNWWGDTIVNPDRIYIGEGATFIGSDPLQSNICNGMSKIAATGTSGEQETNSSGNKFGVRIPAFSTSIDKELDSAMQLKYAKKYEEAISIYDNIITKEGNSSKAILALAGMSNCYRKIKKPGFVDYLEKSVRSKYPAKDNIYAATLE